MVNSCRCTVLYFRLFTKQDFFTKKEKAILKVKNISKKFDSLKVLKNISLQINDDEILAIIGPSGCGKSTLLNIVAGLIKADSGHVEGADDAIAYIFQDDRLLPWRTVFENISLVNDKKDKKEITELIDAVGLTGFEDYLPEQLSGGMKKRCGIARAFYYKSKLLLLDEPFQGLDYSLRQEMLSMLLSVWKKHTQSVLFITHEIDDALSVASRIIVLSGRPSTITHEFSLPYEEGRSPVTPELQDIRQQIISIITG